MVTLFRPSWANVVVAGLWFALQASLLPANVTAQVTAQQAAKEILSELDESKRERLIVEHKSLASDLILEWTKELGSKEASSEDSQAEYQRIPSIWRVAILAVRDPATRDEALTKLMDLSLPTANGSMRDWQAVVLGGAIINGLSLENLWPKAELEKLVSKHPLWKPRWDRALELAKTDAYDSKIPAGTRYDAIRILAMLPAEQAVAKIVPFLDDSSSDAATRD